MRSVVLNRILNSPLLHILLIAIVGLLVYSNIFDVPFHYDDLRFIVNNPLIKDFRYFVDPSGVTLAAEQSNLSANVARFFRTRRVGYLSLWANYKIGGLEVGGYHAFSLVVHIVNSFLVYLIVTLTFRTPLLGRSRLQGHSKLIALFSGLLFVAHPLQTEAVTYVIKRIVLLASTFYLASTAAYIGSRLSGGKAKYVLYALSILFAALGMKTKENVFTLPLAIGLYEFMFFSGGIKRRLLALIPFLLTMLIIPITYVEMNKAGSFWATIEGATKSPGAPPRLDYLFSQAGAVSKYILLLLVPVGQNVDHWLSVSGSFLEPDVLISFLFLLSFFASGIYLYYRFRSGDSALRIAAFGVFWFFITLSVESSVFPIGIVMAEYRVYLPSFGFFMVVASVSFMSSRIKTKLTIAGLALVVLVFSLAAHARNGVWHSELSLWKDTVEKSPQNVRAHNNLGTAYRDKRLFNKAVEHYEIALDLNRDFYEAHYNMGNTYRDMGRIDNAIEQYRIAVRLKPDDAEAYRGLAAAFSDKGMPEKAMEYYNTALSIKPDSAEVYLSLGNSYRNEGLTDKAIENYNIALSVKPSYAEAYYNLGIVYRDKGLTDEAIRQYEAALGIKPDFAEAHNALGAIYQEKGLSDRAIEHFTAALKLRPDYAESHNRVGILYSEMGLSDRAIEHFTAALRLRPDYEEAHLNLGIVYWQMGLREKAMEHYKAAVRLKPDHAQAHFNLGVALWNRGSAQEAIEHFRTALKLKPEYTDARFALGVAYLKNGRKEESRRELENTLRLNPEHRGARNMLDEIRRGIAGK